jgi:hypothetical protein
MFEEYLPRISLIRLQVMGYCLYLVATMSIILTPETGYTRNIKVSFDIWPHDQKSVCWPHGRFVNNSGQAH